VGAHGLFTRGMLLCRWCLALDSDAPEFGGHARVAPDAVFPAHDAGWNGRPACMEVYAPSRSAQVYKLRK
jgi:1,4-alpha-glucan branching enzyme